MSAWKKLADLSWEDRAALGAAAGQLVAVGTMLRFLGFERSVTWLRRSSSASSGGGAASGAASWTRRRARLISIAARHGPYRAQCLERSLVLWWLARRHGFEPELRIGVQAGHPVIKAHAWIEVEGEVVNDRVEVVAEFSTFDASRLPEKASWS